LIQSSQYYSEIIDTKQKKRKYTKISIGSDVLKQIICNIKVRRSSKHDNIDFKPIISKIFSIIPISIVVADKGYDSESNHQYVRDHLNAYSLLFHHDMNMYLYGRLMDDIERR
jgi:Transposase DDE domain